MEKSKAKTVNNKKGFTMLFAVLTSSLILSIGISIFSLTIKELELSSSGRESQFSFYAADSGIECAIYWESLGYFGTSTPPVSPSPVCAGKDISSDWTKNVNGDNSDITFKFNITNPDDVVYPFCVSVVVKKVGYNTTIESRGYNICSSGNPDITKPFLVERALRVKY